MEVEIPNDSGIDVDTSSADSSTGTITPDRDGSECGEKWEEATLVEIEDNESELEKAVGNLLNASTEPVLVMDRDGKSMTLPMPPGASVGDILTQAADHDDVPDSDMYRYRLMYGNQVLDQGKTLAQQGVPRGVVLRLEDEMDLTVTGFDGRNYKVRARPSTSVAEFRRELQRQSGIHPNEQRILFCGKTLTDGAKMSDYKVKNGSSMQLVMRTHSG